MVSEVQIVIFAWGYWSTTRACKWLCKHSFVWDFKVNIKPNFIRFLQFDLSRYKKYRIKKIKPTVHQQSNLRTHLMLVECVIRVPEFC